MPKAEHRALALEATRRTPVAGSEPAAATGLIALRVLAPGVGQEVTSSDHAVSTGLTVLSTLSSICHTKPSYLKVVQLERNENSIAVLGLAFAKNHLLKTSSPRFVQVLSFCLTRVRPGAPL